MALSKLYGLLFTLFIIELVLLLCWHVEDPSKIVDETIVRNSTSLFKFLINPESLDRKAFFDWILNSKLVIIGAGIVIGTFIFAKDFGWRVTVVFTFVTFVMVLVHLWLFVYSWGFWGGDPGLAITMAAFLVSPLILYYIATMIDYVSSVN